MVLAAIGVRHKAHRYYINKLIRLRAVVFEKYAPM